MKMNCSPTRQALSPVFAVRTRTGWSTTNPSDRASQCCISDDRPSATAVPVEVRTVKRIRIREIGERMFDEARCETTGCEYEMGCILPPPHTVK